MYLKDIVVKALVQFIILVAVAIRTYYLAPITKKLVEKMNEKKELEILFNLATTVVKSVEMQISTPKGLAKKSEAITRLVKILNDKGIAVAKEELNAFIEEAVRDIKEDAITLYYN